MKGRVTKMIAALTGYKVIYKERVLRTLALMSVEFEDGDYTDLGKVSKPKAVEVLAINEDGNIVSIMDEAWMFQFIPEIGKRG